MRISQIVIVLATVLTLFACKNKESKEVGLLPEIENFKTTVDGKEVNLFILSNQNGLKVAVCNYGARLVAVITPDKNNQMADITFGYNSIEAYLNDQIYSGPIVGRYANRLKDARFQLDGATYQLFKNDGDNTLHGGKTGLDKVVWSKVEAGGNRVTLAYLSPDGEEGYPGNLSLTKTFTLTENNELKIEYSATTDAPTVINLSNHAYWNLKGEGQASILDHYFMINANHYTPIDAECIPTGEIATVENTPFDFRKGKKVGRDIDQVNEQLTNGKGYDHNWVLNKSEEGEITLAAKLWEETSGRFIEIYTSEPGMQFYSGNFLDGSVTGKSGSPYQHRSGLIFETQHFPDSPNNSNFPTTVLRPGENYQHIAIYKFGVVKAL